ncbi:MAG: twin-arginine translocation pathway signal protein [Caldimonas sp.]
MHRRDFVRLVGGGALVGAGGLLGACSSQYPASAVAAWQGPTPDGDLRRWALAHAVLAPSSHNRQPWLVDLREPDAITLHVDRERMLPETDPWFRQIVVSQGTFLELLVIALRERGVEPKVALFPDGEFTARGVDDRPVARISWNGTTPRATPDPLFGQILRRHTAKVEYDRERPVAAATLGRLAEALKPDAGVRFGGTVDPARLPALRQLCQDAAVVELGTPRTVMESIRLLRVGPTEIAKHRDGLSINTPMLRALDAVGLFDRSHPPAAGDAAFKNMLAQFDGYSRSAGGFVWLGTAPPNGASAGTGRRAEVTAGRAYMRLQLQATALGLQMHPMSQAIQEFAEMKPLYERLHQLTVGQPAERETVQMFCRIGYCSEQQHAPRRGVDAIIRA